MAALRVKNELARKSTKSRAGADSESLHYAEEPEMSHAA
jgi:hypothetical protein